MHEGCLLLFLHRYNLERAIISKIAWKPVPFDGTFGQGVPFLVAWGGGPP